MSTNGQNGKTRARVLRALDSDFPLLATRAAIEIDRLLAKEETSLDSVYKLANLLQQPRVEVQGATTGSLLDPATLIILNRAMSEAELADGMILVDDLIAKSMEISGLLSASAEPSTERQQLGRLKRFCIALSDIAASYRQSIFGDVSPHPYKA